MKATIRAGSVVLVLVPLAAHAQAPLPVIEGTKPALVLVVDRSGSMATCDGGPASNPFVPETLNRHSFFPCAPGTYDRQDAAIAAIQQLLDVNRDGTIDSSDEALAPYRIGSLAYDDAGFYAIHPVGTAFEKVFCGDNLGAVDECSITGATGAPAGKMGIEDLVPGGNTPTGEAIDAAVLQSLNPCYDGNTATLCPLSGLDPTLNDPGSTCRLKALVVLTDGQSNGALDPVIQAGVVRGLSANHYVYSIGLGAGVNLGELNCIGRMGGTDAQRDDTNINTVDGAAVTCAGGQPYSAEAGPPGLGNAFVASNAAALVSAFQSIVNQLNAGSFSRSRPVVARGGKAAYVSYLDVKTTRVDWQGHLKKYAMGDDFTAIPAYSGILDCDDKLKPDSLTAPKACWDGAAMLGGPGQDPGIARGANDTLDTRTWTTRKIYTVVPKDAVGSKSSFDSDQFKKPGKEKEVHGAGVGVMSAATADARNVPAGQWLYDFSALASGLASGSVTVPATFAVDGGSLTDDQQKFLMIAHNLLRVDDEDYPTLDAAAAAKAKGLIEWIAGRPTSTFANGQKRCDVQTGCTDSATAWKMGDVFDSKPTVVAAPILSVDDPDFGDFVNATGSYSAFTIADSTLCNAPATAPCAVKNRKTVVYTAANDGMIHAFHDDTGKEIWAYLPWEVMDKVTASNASRTTILNNELTIREVKFPTDNNGDGKWHTVLFLTLGEGGHHVSALDVTLPDKPKFLWSYRKPEKMGMTMSLGNFGRTDAGKQRLFFTGGMYPGDNLGVPEVSFECAAGLSVWGTPPAGNGNMSSCVAGCTNPATFDDCVEQCEDDCKDSCGNCEGDAAFPYGDEEECEKACTPSGGGPHTHFFSIWPHNPQDSSKDKHEPSQPGLSAAYTSPAGVKADMPGSLKIVDAEANGHTERGYYGDVEGRVWKGCDLGTGGSGEEIKLHLFFDPAYYFFAPPVNTDYDGSKTPAPAVSVLEMKKRSPIFWQPEVAVATDTDYLWVAIGGGDRTRLTADPDTLGYTPHVWVAKDRVDGDLATALGGAAAITSNFVKDDPSCAAAASFVCATPAPTPNAVIPATRPLPPAPGAIPLCRTYGGLTRCGHLTGPVAIFNGVLLFTQYIPDPDLNVCVNDGESQLRAFALAGSPCDGTAGVTPFNNGADSEVAFTPSDGIVSSPVVDPVSGNVIVVSSRVDGDNPIKVIDTNLKSGAAAGVRSWREIN